MDSSSPLAIRLRAVLAFTVLVAIGVPSKWYDGPWKEIVVGQLWDLCGTMAVFFLVRILGPKIRGRWIGLSVWVALMTNELLQLVNHPTLDALRQTRLGAALLGSDFGVLDLVVITSGLAAALCLDRWWVRRASSP